MLRSTVYQYLNIQRWPCSDFNPFLITKPVSKDGVPEGPVHGLETRPRRQGPVSKVESNIRLSSIPHSLGVWVA